MLVLFLSMAETEKIIYGFFLNDDGCVSLDGGGGGGREKAK